MNFLFYSREEIGWRSLKMKPRGILIAHLVDLTGERRDVTRAKSIGFKPDRFQHGVGKTAFAPLDDEALGEGPVFGFRDPRVIGVADGAKDRAWSIPKLSRHEIANSHLGGKAAPAGY